AAGRPVVLLERAASRATVVAALAIRVVGRAGGEAGARAGARQTLGAVGVRIAARGVWRAGADGGRRATLAGTRAGARATDAVRAETGDALVVGGARGPDVQLRDAGGRGAEEGRPASGVARAAQRADRPGARVVPAGHLHGGAARARAVAGAR